MVNRKYQTKKAILQKDKSKKLNYLETKLDC